MSDNWDWTTVTVGQWVDGIIIVFQVTDSQLVRIIRFF